MKHANKIKVCMLTVQHSALDDRIFYKESQALQQAGYEVVILCKSDKRGRLFGMSGELLNPDGASEISVEGIRIKGIKPSLGLWQDLSQKFFRGKFYRNFLAAALAEDADIYHCHEPQSYHFGYEVSKITKAKIIYDAHESWTTGSPKDMWIKKRFLPANAYLISVNEGVRDYLMNFHQPKLTEIIVNASSLDLFPLPPEKLNKVSPPLLVHEGALTMNRGLELMLLALVEIRKQFPYVKLKIIGEAKGETKQYLDQMKEKYQLQKNLIETGWVPYQNVYKELLPCSIGLILFTDTPNNRFSTSNKLFNYLAACLATVSVNLPYTTSFLKEWGNGRIIEERDPNLLASEIIYLFENPKILTQLQQNARKAYANNNWEQEKEKLLKFYESILAD